MSASVCPHCGSPLAPRAVACRECGSDLETGWNRDVDYLSVELPEDDIPNAERGPVFRTVGILCIAALLGGAIVLLGGQPFSVFIAIALAAPIAFGLRKSSGDGG